jgi:hypothetical protein
MADDQDQSLVDNIKIGAKVFALPSRILDKVLNEPILSVVAVGLIAFMVYVGAYLGPEIMGSVQGRYDTFQSENKAILKETSKAANDMLKEHQVSSNQALSEQRKDLLEHNNLQRADYLQSIKESQDTAIKAHAAQTDAVKEAVKDLRDTVKELGKGAWLDTRTQPPLVTK